MPVVLSSTRIDQLKFGVSFFDFSLNFFPVDLEFFSLFNFTLIIYDNWIREISFSEDNFASLFIIVINTFILFLGGFIVTLVITLSSFRLLGESLFSCLLTFSLSVETLTSAESAHAAAISAAEILSYLTLLQFKK